MNLVGFVVSPASLKGEVAVLHSSHLSQQFLTNLKLLFFIVIESMTYCSYSFIDLVSERVERHHLEVLLITAFLLAIQLSLKHNHNRIFKFNY